MNYFVKCHKDNSMYTMIKLGLLLTICLSGLSVAAQVDPEKILDEERGRAKEFRDLEYQAKVLEQRAKVAKAYKQLKAEGGYIPSEIALEFEGESRSDLPVRRASSISIDDEQVLPELVSIKGSNAKFKTSQGNFNVGVGGALPGGYKVLSISIVDGVKLKKDDTTYVANFEWLNNAQ